MLLAGVSRVSCGRHTAGRVGEAAAARGVPRAGPGLRARSPKPECGAQVRGPPGPQARVRGSGRGPPGPSGGSGARRLPQLCLAPRWGRGCAAPGVPGLRKDGTEYGGAVPSASVSSGNGWDP